MNMLPQRSSLVTLAVESLRDALQRGLWTDHLPGERGLCERLNISRPTLRAALEQLQREGWLEASHGKRRRILKAPATPSQARQDIVGLLTPVPLLQLPPFALYWMDKLRELLHAGGFKLEVHCGREWFTQRPERALERLVLQSPSAAWVMFRSTEAMQRWFERRALPAVISGTGYADLRVPSVDVDYRALCRHAAGLLLARGHRRLVLIVPNSGQAGDRASEIGFSEACVRSSSAVTPQIVRHGDSAASVRALTDELLNSSKRPTGFLVARSIAALAVHGCLLRKGLRIPQDAAMIARDDDRFLDYTTPELTRYHYDGDLHARRLFRMVMSVARGQVPGKMALLAMPRLVVGATL